jgi:hypothetical protein
MLVVCLATTDPRLSLIHLRLHRSHLSLHNPSHILCSGLGGGVDRWTPLSSFVIPMT